MEKIILVLDKEEYRQQEGEIIDLFQNKGFGVKVVYTKYEDWLIRSVRGWKVVGNLLQHIIYWLKSLNYAIKISLQSGSSKIICINPIVGYFLGMLNGKKKQSITLCGFLFAEKTNRVYYNLRLSLTKRFLKGISNIVVYSSREVAYYQKIFGMGFNFQFVLYGIDYNTNGKYLGDIPKEYVFSGGGSNRDYTTLVEMYNCYSQGSIPDMVIATLPHYVEKIDTSKVKMLYDVTLETFGDVIQHSKFVILSLKDLEVSAGHQVLLQVLKENKIVLVNKIPAIEDYVTEANVIFYESGNQEDLYQKIRYIKENYAEILEKYKENNKFYNNNYTFVKFLARLIII